MDTPPSSNSWQDLARRAAAESPPDIDVRALVRSHLEMERTRLPQAAPDIFDDIAALTRGWWAASAWGTAAVLLVWQIIPALREIAFAIQLHGQLLAGL